MSTMKTSNGEAALNVESFNLVDQPWIPVVDASGKSATVGLRELFERAEELSDLATGTLETIALYRLLFCIAQRALGDLEDEDDWLGARKRLTEAAVKYLEEWKGRFDLFDKKYPFLQIAGLRLEKADKSSTDLNKTDKLEAGSEIGNSKTDKLDFGLAVGDSTSTVFDQNAIEEGRIHTPEWLAVKLLTFQCFSPGGRIGNSNLLEITENNKNSSSDAPCAEGSMLLTILKGECLAQTICWNLLTKEQIGTRLENGEMEIVGKPVWECDIIGNEQERKNLKYSFLGRLVPLSRFVKLINCRNMILAAGIVYAKLPQYRESMGTILKSDREGYIYLSTDPECSPWRNLYALLIWKYAEGDSRRGAVALNNLVVSYENEPNEFFSIWVGGLAHSQAKVIDTANWTVRIRSKLLGEESRNLYEKGIQLADFAQYQLDNAIKAYEQALIDPNLSFDPKKQRGKESSKVALAKYFFWNSLEKSQDKLQEYAVNGNLDDWKRLLGTEKIATYKRICSRLTSRQLEAYTKGKEQLFSSSQDKKKKSGVKKDAKKDKEK